jgi:hypothetical protein
LGYTYHNFTAATLPIVDFETLQQGLDYTSRLNTYRIFFESWGDDTVVWNPARGRPASDREARRFRKNPFDFDIEHLL